MSRFRWSDLDDIWSPDHPANRRAATGLARMAQQAAGRPGQSTATCESTPTPQPVLDESASRRKRVIELLARLRAGDSTVRDALKQLLP
jgi:hypothetical protein